MQKNSAIILGLMSGTSCDGLDLALCRFFYRNNTFGFKLIKAKTIAYNVQMKKKLSAAFNCNANALMKLNADFASYCANEVNKFNKKNKILPHFISSHGHTVFHEPNNGFSTQIGCGATIAAKTSITTICDYRSIDVALKGQGAPLVPIGDKLLFGKYDACLNLGGIANISYTNKKGNAVAYDICILNMALNYFAEKIGKNYDNRGIIAKNNNFNADLLKKLNTLSYYKKSKNKSLGREYFESIFLNTINKHKLEPQIVISTLTQHFAHVISNEIKLHNLQRVLVTGGGAYNLHLINLINEQINYKLHIPSKEIINFKEAIIFGFLGFLRINHQHNTLKTVTGALKSTCSGAIYVGCI
ncbi:MAG: anhydro-N-acetylmuramic acid kinase [Bacteroidetes bacterium]|nr:anhydro-N-acetylmuramic acid kinase [Bacteroidota bacterium]